MKNPIKIVEHISDRCPDGLEHLQRYEPASNVPELWIQKAFNMLDENFTGIGINGYTVNFPKKSVVNIVLKREFVGDFKNPGLDALLQSEIVSYIYQNRKRLQKYIDIAIILRVPFYFITTPYMYPSYDAGFKPEERLIYIYNFSDLDNPTLDFQFNTSELEQWLINIKNYKFKENKPLNYADMYLSCYMSKFTNNQLPGDLDYCVFYKKNNKKTIAFLFEFKTHNLDKPIKDENMSNYKAQDFRRFSVFNFLLRQIKDRQNYSPIFVYLAWGTDITLVNHENIKLDFMYYSEESRSLKYFYNSIIKNPELSNSYQELKQTLNDAIKKFKEDIK